MDCATWEDVIDEILVGDGQNPDELPTTSSHPKENLYISHLLALLLAAVSLATAHAPRPDYIHYGIFVRETPDSTTEWPWTRITLYHDGKFGIELGVPEGESELGYGNFEYAGDTLILKNIESSLFSNGWPWNLDNIMIPELRYLTRTDKKHSFEILPLTKGAKKPPKWTTLERPSKCK